MSNPINKEGGSALLARLREMHKDVIPPTGQEPAGLLAPDAPSRVNDAPAAPAATVAESTAEPTKAKRARKKAGDVAEAPNACAEAPAAGGSEEADAWQGHPAPDVFVDCYPVKGASRPTPLELWLAPLAAQVAEGHSVKDWRMIQFTAKAELGAKIRDAIDTVPAVVLVSSSAPGSDVFLEVVLPYAKTVVRALRG